MNGDRIGLKAKPAICCEPGIHIWIIVGDIRFQAQKHGVLFASNSMSMFNQSC
jgi:hypothetical protein